MTSHSKPSSLFFWFAAVGMGLFLRRSSAFVWSSTAAHVISRPTSSVYWGRHSLQIRGGNAFNPAHSATRATRKKLQASTTDASSLNLEDVIEKEARDCLSIVGTEVSASIIEGIPYLNTKECNAFRVLFVLGGPGAGKGTQSDLMKAEYPCVHLSAGELLRAETRKENSPHKDLIESCLVSGNIVPVEISLSLLQSAMQEAADQNGKSLIFLVDGFPRNFDNLDGWIRCMAGVATVWGVLNYQCPLEELERRILLRAKDSGRSDDNLESARKRFATFERDTVPVVDTLRRVEELLEQSNQPALHVFDIRGDQSIDDVWNETQSALNRIVSYDVMTAQSQLWQAIETNNVDLYRQLCADEWFDNDEKSPEDIMAMQEGDGSVNVSDVQLGFISGTKVSIEYDRVLDSDVKVHEKRIWSHQGTDGWKNIHFVRTPPS